MKNLATETGFWSSMTKTEFKKELAVDPRPKASEAVFTCVATHRFTAALVPNTQHTPFALGCPKHTGSDLRLLSTTDFNVSYCNCKDLSFRETWVRYRKQRILTLSTILLPHGSIYLINSPLDWIAFEHLIFKTEFELLTWVRKNNFEFWLGVRIKCQNVFF